MSFSEKKREVLPEQKRDLSVTLNQLPADIKTGHKQMNVYKQLKLYDTK